MTWYKHSQEQKTYPIYFGHTQPGGFRAGTAYVRLDSPEDERSVLVYDDGKEIAWRVRGDCFKHVKFGFWKEITKEEALSRVNIPLPNSEFAI